MNFDFAIHEREYFNRLKDSLEIYTKKEIPEKNECEMTRATIQKGLALLADIGYLKMGLGNDKSEIKGNLNLMVCREIMAAASQSLYLSIEMGTRMFGKIVSAWGVESQKEMLLPLLAHGKILGALALSEHAMNIDNDPLKTMGADVGDCIDVTGDKSYVINGPIADWLAVAGKMDDGYAIFLVEKGVKGLTISDKVSTLGYEDVQISGLRIANCRIRPDNVIRPPAHEDFLKSLRLWENQILIGASLGMMKSSFESARSYAKTHHTGGEPIIAYQEVAFKLAEMLALYQTSRLLAFRSAWISDIHPKEGYDLTLCAKVFCTESAEKIASQALQVLSGFGYQKGNKAECAYRCAKYLQIAGTSTEIARVRIGDGALGYR